MIIWEDEQSRPAQESASDLRDRVRCFMERYDVRETAWSIAGFLLLVTVVCFLPFFLGDR